MLSCCDKVQGAKICWPGEDGDQSLMLKVLPVVLQRNTSSCIRQGLDSVLNRSLSIKNLSSLCRHVELLFIFFTRDNASANTRCILEISGETPRTTALYVWYHFNVSVDVEVSFPVKLGVCLQAQAAKITLWSFAPVFLNICKISTAAPRNLIEWDVVCFIHSVVIPIQSLLQHANVQGP